MKELSIEEKAKAYDSAIKEAKDIFVGRKKMYNDINTTLEHLFPELKEHDDDERTKNQLIDFVKLSLAGFPQCEKYIAWINKHCEQKSSDKVEPKFKVGDWIVLYNNHRSIYQIEKIENYQYIIRHILGGSMPLSFALENNIKLWTINDAKDGDVLQLGKVTAIFKKYISNECCICYCSFCKDGGFEIPIANGEDNDYGYSNATPATKEQRDQLFQKMKEAGYEWDDNKKELRKVNSDVQSNKDEATTIITGDLLIKNGFKHHEGIFSNYYDKKFNNEILVDLIQGKTFNAKWTLEILKASGNINRLVEVISTVDELQRCLDDMDVELKIKY